MKRLLALSTTIALVAVLAVPLITQAAEKEIDLTTKHGFKFTLADGYKIQKQTRAGEWAMTRSGQKDFIKVFSYKVGDTFDVSLPDAGNLNDRSFSAAESVPGIIANKLFDIRNDYRADSGLTRLLIADYTIGDTDYAAKRLVYSYKIDGNLYKGLAVITKSGDRIVGFFVDAKLADFKAIYPVDLDGMIQSLIIE